MIRQSRVLKPAGDGNYILLSAVNGEKNTAWCPFVSEHLACGTWCALFRVTREGSHGLYYTLGCAGSPVEEYARHGGDE